MISEEALLSRAEYFAQVQLWPRQALLDPRAWLSNFTVDEKKYAIHLLNGFMFYSDEMINTLFLGAVQALSRDVVVSKKSFLAARGEWDRFRGTAVVVRVTGETPSEADSGYLFSRRARDLLSVDEPRLVPHDRLVARLLAGPSTPVLFVDDFVGSGNQFVEMWNRKYSALGSTKRSLAEISAHMRGMRFYYTPLVCTEAGRRKIQKECPSVQLRPGHLLDERYGVFHANSIVWPSSVRANALHFIESASRRAGIPDNGGDVGDWRGFHKLGLALAFAHGTPDATLPMFTWSKNGWHPLLRKP